MVLKLAEISKPYRRGIQIGLFALLISLISVLLITLVPKYLSDPRSQLSYLTIYAPIITSISDFIKIGGIPLIIIMSTIFLHKTKYNDIRIIFGFLVGGLLNGIGEICIDLIIGHVLLPDPALQKSIIELLITGIFPVIQFTFFAMTGVVFITVFERFVK